MNHAFRWRNGVQTNLGALTGNSNSFAFGLNDRGWVAGVSENGAVDPMTGSPEMRAVLWKDGEIINLGTLGGNTSGANAVNNRDQVVGGALTAVPATFPDTFFNSYIFESFPFYFFPLDTESHAFLWQEGEMQDLGTLGGPDSVAWFVNERGQVAGQSSTNSIANSTTHIPTVDPFFWDRGKMIDVGNLGGTYGYVTGLNNRGQVIGTMTLPGDVNYHPFLWSSGVLTDLGTFGGTAGVGQANAINDAGEVVGWASVGNAVFSFIWRDGVLTNLGTVNGEACNVASGINYKGQVVGESSSSCFDPLSPVPTTGFLWGNGSPMVDLNTLVPRGSGIHLATGASINDHGEIAGRGILPNGDNHAVILIPCDEDHADVEGCDYHMVDEQATTRVNLPSVGQESSAKAPGTWAPYGPVNDVRGMFRWGRSSRFVGIPQKVALSGTAAISGPIATLSLTTLTFWPSAIGTTNGASSVTLTNTGTTSLNIGRIAITGPNAQDFTQTHSCASSLAAGASCEIDVTFRATQFGNRTGTLSVADNAHGSPQTVSLIGTGTDVVLSPAALTFNCVSHLIICGCQTSGTVTLTNLSSTTLKITGIAVSGGPYSETNSCGATVAAGGSCSIKVRWSPLNGVGIQQGLISIGDNGHPSLQTLGLRGYKRCSAH